ncbi:MAG TPA: membrane protein insertase YidC [Marinilabiliaceae bacterium]|nr:membrane protein insertase YidC [Marinilabiliaceae bacterium]
MDRNSITGLIIITLILIGFWFINKPSEQEIEAIRQRQDSLRIVELKLEQEKLIKQLQAEAEKATISVDVQSSNDESSEVSSVTLQQQYGQISPFIEGEKSFTTLENEKIKMILSNQGGKIYSVELKKYKTSDGDPLVLFDGDKNQFGFNFTHNTRIFNTNQLYFNLKSQTDTSVVYELALPTGESLAFTYTLPKDEYMAKFTVNTNNLQHLMATPRGSIDFNWYMQMPSFEKGRSFEQQYSGLYYKFYKDEVDWLRSTKDDSKDLRTKIKWIGFKSQFFSSVFIADDAFSSASVESKVEEDKTSEFLQYNSAEVVVPIDLAQNQELDFRFYFGPNHFYTLNNYGKDLELGRLINLGWGILGWINRYAVIPVFNFLAGFISNFGIIILILTLLIKLVLFPFTYKSYISSAKMKVLKPQIEEINARIPKDKAMERQQATMALYKKVGVNPMGGCLPMLLQMPILIAMFRFFPASIELRQESFLWATDLSSYDSILNLPFTIPFYGSHVSLFTLLMAGTNIFYTKMNSEMTQSTNQMPGMKGMMYMMPIMFLFIFNSYASGLSYYYFVSTLITVGQTFMIRQFVDDKKILAKLHANQKKPTKKSGFAQRLEKMAKQQQQMKKRR